jgi:TPP-dependent pyruvate/acetoin dehydrogenase alpha subunit
MGQFGDPLAWSEKEQAEHTSKQDRITKARELLFIWDRKDEKINDAVWSHIDKIVDSMIKRAYADKAFEAFAYLSKLKEIIITDEVVNLKATLQILMSPDKPHSPRK